jgi:hypothetical protein
LSSSEPCSFLKSFFTVWNSSFYDMISMCANSSFVSLNILMNTHILVIYTFVATIYLNKFTKALYMILVCDT